MGNMMRKLQMRPTAVDNMEVTSNIKAQSQGAHDIYKLVKPPVAYPVVDRGILVEATKEAFRTKDFDKLHQLIRATVGPYLYDGGHVREIPIKLLVERRNAERKKKVKSEEEASNKRTSILARQQSVVSAQFNYKDSKQTRRCCWSVDKRAALGETVLHLCMLNNSQVHNLLAKEIIKVFPEMMHDIYLSDEYYGENVMHMAIANEDLPMIKFILKQGKKIGLNMEERCCGNFFSPLDQKKNRRDRSDSEVITASVATNYKGMLYWGEHPLMFAACSNQPKVFTLLLNSGADISCQDYNGNNILHMMVLHNNTEIFNMAHAKGGRKLLEMENNQKLTPLTLAATLANKQMLDHIMELRREIEWAFGDVTCAKYPLSDVDTINWKDGSINRKSALSIILGSSKKEHLAMLDGLLYQLLHEKWKQYGKVHFYRRALLFLVYLGCFIGALLLQPTPSDDHPACYLLNASDGWQIARFVLELIVVLSCIIYLTLASIELYNQCKYVQRFRDGLLTFLWTITNAPTKGLFLLSCLLIIIVIPCRFACNQLGEHVLLTFAIINCFPYLLFFCRGFKLVGPFVTTMYEMWAGDMLRFVILYAIFVLAFSQAMYVLFRGTAHQLFSDPFQAAMGMVIITLGEFGDLYDDFDSSRIPWAAKATFIVFMIVCTLLLINMLIAMMGSTFNKVAETRWEWQRQWAKVVLVMEQSVSPDHRIRKQRRYSQPDDVDDSRWFVVRNFKRK